MAYYMPSFGSECRKYTFGPILPNSFLGPNLAKGDFLAK